MTENLVPSARSPLLWNSGTFHLPLKLNPHSVLTCEVKRFPFHLSFNWNTCSHPNSQLWCMQSLGVRNCAHYLPHTGSPGQLAVLTALSPRENKQELQWVTELWQIHNFKWGLSGPTHLTMPYNALPYEVNNHGAPGQSGPELCVGGINKKQVCNLEVETDK